MKRFSAWVLLPFFFIPKIAFSIEGVYLGAQLGHVALTGDTTQSLTNAIGFGGFVGVKTSSLMDVSFHLQMSSHGGGSGLTLYAPFISADFLLTKMSELELSVGAGPGLYLLQSTTSSSKFGLHAGVAADVVLDDRLRLGLHFRYHKLLDSNSLISGWVNTQARMSYQF